MARPERFERPTLRFVVWSRPLKSLGLVTVKSDPNSQGCGVPKDKLGCRISFAGPATRSSSDLEREAGLGNKSTYPSMVALCDDLLDDDAANRHRRKGSRTSLGGLCQPTNLLGWPGFSG
jgi:hypothetical protein